MSSLINYCTTTRLYRKGGDGSWRKCAIERDSGGKMLEEKRDYTEEVLDESRRKLGWRGGGGGLNCKSYCKFYAHELA
jgi:hypothetical protein